MKTTSSTLHIGQFILNLRKQRNMTGIELGEKVNLSQSKISKIENGYYPQLQYAEIENILNILDAPKTIRQQISLAMTRQQPKVLIHRRYSYSYDFDRPLELERNATTIRMLLFDIIPAILQTMAYRESYLQCLNIKAENIQLAMKNSLLRQDLIWEGRRKYFFLIAEPALYTVTGTDIAVQVGQLDRLERLIGVSNLSLGIIPLEAGMSVMESSSFSVYDEQLAGWSETNIEVESKDSEVILQYLKVFTEREQVAHYGDDAKAIIQKAINYFQS